MKSKLAQAYMATARIFAELSHAQRLHVGAIVVKDDRIISIGYNGMPTGWPNDCEHKEYSSGDEAGWLSPEEIEASWPHKELVHDTQSDDTVWTHTRRFRLKTNPEVLHAERNALDKLAKGNEGGRGATMFITHAPCLECSKSIYGAGITQIYYAEEYRSTDGINFLEKCNVNIKKLPKEDK